MTTADYRNTLRPGMRPTLCLVFLATWIGALPLAGQDESDRGDVANSPASRYYVEAREAAVEGRPALAVSKLQQACAAGFETPADVLRENAFRSLRQKPETRRQLHRLLKQYGNQTSVTMVAPDEPGERLTIRGQVIDRETGQPISGATIYLFHTDHAGLYAPERHRAGDGTNNPRLFAYLQSDERGKFTINTIQPASYPGYNNMRHIHYVVSAEGHGQLNSQCYINGDPEADQQRREIAADRGWPILELVPLSDGFQCELTITL